MVLLLFFINFTVTVIIVFIITVHFKRETLNNQMHLLQKNSILPLQAKEINFQHDELTKQKLEIEQKNTNITTQYQLCKKYPDSIAAKA